MLLGSTVWGLLQVAAVHVSMYLPNSLSKVSQETLPFQSLLGSSFSQLQLLPHPTFLCHPGGLCRLGGLRGWWRGMGAVQYILPFGLKARGFKKLKFQPLFPPSECVEPEGATSLLQLLLLDHMLEEGALGGNQGGLELF